MDEALVDARGLALQRGARTVWQGVDLRLLPGERLLLSAPSGAGKTSLLHALLGFVPLAAGEVRLRGQLCRSEREFARQRGPVGLVFQDPADQLLGPTAEEDAAFGPLNQGYGRADALALAYAALAQLGIAHLARRPVHALSGGEQRLCAIAGVLAMQPQVLLLDEPTVGLDAPAADRLLALLHGTGLALVLASHDTRGMDGFATRIQALPQPCA